jgi:hypothetical protein
MFGWFSPKCPLDTYEKTWTEWRMRWLADQFGVERLLQAEVILPTDEFFPGRYSGTAEDAQGLLDRFGKRLGIDTRTISLEVLPDVQMPGVAGHYDRGEQTFIRIAESQLAAPLQLVATLLHELAHEMLLGGGKLTADVADHEWVTDLLPVFFGLGVFAANATISEEYHHEGQSSWWFIGKHGYLPARVFGYAMALFAFARGERDPAWAKHLRLDASSALQGGLRYVRKTNDTLFHPDTMRGKRQPPSAGELSARLRTGSPSVRLFALWEIGEGTLTDPDVVTAVGQAVKDADETVSATACRTLAGMGTAAEPATQQLVEAVSKGGEIARVEAACALGVLRLRPDLVVPELCAMLKETEGGGIAEIAAALRQYGVLAEPATPRLFDALASASVNCDYGLIETLVGTLVAITPDLKARASERFPERGSEPRRLLLAAMKERRGQDQGIRPGQVSTRGGQ